MNTTEQVVESNPSRFQRFQDKLAASRFLTFSLLLHVFIVLFAGTVVIFRQQMAATDFAPEGSAYVSEEASTEPPRTPEEAPVPQLQSAPPVATAPSLDVVVTHSTAPAALTMPPVMPSIKGPAMSLMAELPLGGSDRWAPVHLPPQMDGRRGGTRTQLMEKFKMMPKSEQAVLAGLKWLKEHQNADGSWGPKFPTAMTGLAVLCLLGHGETPETPDFGPTTKKGVDWLLNKGLAAQGALAGSANGFGQTDVYEHAIGAYALGEYYTMTRDERVKDVLTQAVTYIVQGQAADGGWLYRYEKAGDSDTSVTGWQIQALKAAHLTGLSIPGVDEALDKAMLDLKRVQAANGGFGYHKPEEAKYSLTGVGVLCTYFWKGQKDKSVHDGIKFILDKTQTDNPVEYRGPKADLYAWYYDTQACLMVGGDAWKKWNGWFQSQIADSQSPDGSWPPTGNARPIGGLESDPEGSGQVYRTAMSVLMLEVYYRYMPPAN